MDYNKPPPIPPPPPPPPPPPRQYAQQQGQINQPPPHVQQQGEHACVISASTSLEGMVEYIARGAAIVTIFLATLLVGTSNQSKYDVAMKFTQFSAFKYFLAASIIVLIYSIASLVTTIIIKSTTIIPRLSIAIADIVFVSMLLTANGAASAVSKQLGDGQVCDYYERFCSQIKASIAMSMLTVGCYLGLTILCLVTFACKKT